MTIYLGTDHAGFELKEYIKKNLTEHTHTVVDFGATELDPEDDYPLFIKPVADAVSKNPNEVRGIIFGGSGQGEAIVANRSPHVRAAVYYGGPQDIVRLSREHNDSNVLSLGARFLTQEEAWEVVQLWLTTDFSRDERHMRRLAAFT